MQKMKSLKSVNGEDSGHRIGNRIMKVSAIKVYMRDCFYLCSIKSP